MADRVPTHEPSPSEAPPGSPPVVPLLAVLKLLARLLGASAAGVRRVADAAASSDAHCQEYSVVAGPGPARKAACALPPAASCTGPIWVADTRSSAAPEWARTMEYGCFAAVTLEDSGGSPFACLWAAFDKPRAEDERTLDTLSELAPILIDGIMEAARYQDALRDTTRRLQALYEASADGILMVDANLRISVANRRFGEFFGLDPAAVIGADDAKVRAAVFGCLKDPVEFERRVGELYSDPAAEGEDEIELALPVPRMLHRSSGPVRDERGEVLGRLWLFRDVTIRRRMERELRESKQQLEDKARLLAEADRLKSQFLANTSHELRTPLNSLLGFLKLILEGAGATPEEERSLLAYAYNTGTHLATLLNDILDLAKIEAGSVPLNLEWIDASKLLDEVIPISAVQARAKGLTCELLAPAADGPRVRADYLRLRQVLLNLIGNAVKYTSAGSITVGVEPDAAAGKARIRIDDTGLGMDEAMLTAARSGQFTPKSGRGAGSLGLSIARRYLALMGASLDFRSAGPELGTSVLVELEMESAAPGVPPGAPATEGRPAVEPPRPAPPLAAAPRGSATFLGNLRVLVVEDDLPSAQAIRMALERLGGFSVTECEDVARILSLARGGNLDVALVDVSLAHSAHEGKSIDGLAITRLLKSDPRTRHIPVVLMTAHAMAGDRERMLSESGADDYVSKPILDVMALMRRLSELAGR